MKLTDILNGTYDAAEWEAKGYELPKYDLKAVQAKTYEEPTWVHFGAGNIFRAFTAAVLNDVLNAGKYDRGIVVDLDTQDVYLQEVKKYNVDSDERRR